MCHTEKHMLYNWNTEVPGSYLLAVEITLMGLVIIVLLRQNVCWEVWKIPCSSVFLSLRTRNTPKGTEQKQIQGTLEVQSHWRQKQ